MRDPLPAAAARCAGVLWLAMGAAICHGDPGAETEGKPSPGGDKSHR